MTLICSEHATWLPCRECLRREGFYDPCAICGKWRGMHWSHEFKEVE